MLNGKVKGILVGLVFSPSIFAVELDIRGFTTAGLSITDTDKRYLGADKDGTFNESSLMGLNMRFRPDDAIPIQFVTQLVAQASDGWNLEAEWAYVSWSPTYSLNITAGRERAPLFMISETYHVGQTYPWIRPPEEIYGDFNVPLDSVDKIALDYTVETDDWSFNSEIFLGDGKLEAPLAGTRVSGNVDKAWGAIFTASSEQLSVRLAAIGVNVDIFGNEFVQQSADIKASTDATAQQFMALTAQLTGLNAAIAAGDTSKTSERDTVLAQLAQLESDIQAGNARLAVLENIPITGKTWYYFLGYRYENDRILTLGEVGRRDMDDFPYQNTNTGFITFGYKFNKLMPHFTYSRIQASKVEMIAIEQETFIFGGVYSVYPWASLKAELQHIRLTDTYVDGFINIGLQEVTPIELGGTGVPVEEINKASLAVSIVF